MARLCGKLTLNFGWACFILRPVGIATSTARVSAMTGFLMGLAGFPDKARGTGVPAGPLAVGGWTDGYSGNDEEAGRVVVSFHERIVSGDILRIDELFCV